MLREQQVDQLHPHRRQEQEVHYAGHDLSCQQSDQAPSPAGDIGTARGGGDGVKQQPRGDGGGDQGVEEAQAQKDVGRRVQILGQARGQRRGREERVSQRGDGPAYPQHYHRRQAHAGHPD